jgi:hypothetical protein
MRFTGLEDAVKIMKGEYAGCLSTGFQQILWKTVDALRGGPETATVIEKSQTGDQSVLRRRSPSRPARAAARATDQPRFSPRCLVRLPS